MVPNVGRPILIGPRALDDVLCGDELFNCAVIGVVEVEAYAKPPVN